MDNIQSCLKYYTSASTLNERNIFKLSINL